MSKVQRVVFRSNDILTIIRLGTTKNEKIARPNEIIVQTYHFSKEQYEFFLNSGSGISLKSGFLNPDLTEKNCGECPLRFGGCYTFKFNQAMGHRKMLTTLVEQYGIWSNVPEIDTLDLTKIQEFCDGRYIRFGSYGNPTQMPLFLMEWMIRFAKNWSGYTHDWKDIAYKGYMNYLMASGHADKPEWNPTKEFRFFVTDGDGVQCPASDEYYEKTGKKITCSDCGLCSGLLGKGKGNIRITTH